MSSLNEQRKTVQKLTHTTKLEKKILLDVLDSVEKAFASERLIKAIYEAAKKNREFCVHCDSVAKVIEDFKR